MVQIDQDVAAVAVLGVGLDVNVTSLAVANAQKSYRCRLRQLGSRPKPFARECSSDGVVNQTDQIQVVGHRRELPTDGLQRESESAIEHGRHDAIEEGCRTMDFQPVVSSVLTDRLSRGAHSRGLLAAKASAAFAGAPADRESACS